jgi:phosphatidate cytidylyltransferase
MTDVDKKKRSNLAVRFMTAGVAAPLILWMLFIAPTWVWPCFVLVLANPIAAQELFGMTLRGEKRLQAWGIASCLLVGLGLYQAVTVSSPLLGAPFDIARFFPIGLVLWALSTMLFTLSRPLPHEQAGNRMAWLLGGPLYIGGTLANLAALHSVEHGGGWVLLSMVLAWLADTFGYFSGRFLGGKVFGPYKLSPHISPNKTWEGAAGAVLGCLTAITVAHFWFQPALSLEAGVVIALIAAPLGVCGDLVESLIKRSTGAKDSGWIVPGHGGLIDRIDALMFTATLVLVYAKYIMPA